MLTRSARAAAALLLATVGLAAPVAAQGPIDHAAWLSGCWEARTPTRSVFEMWMPPSGGVMMGAGRTVVNGVTREFEQLRLHVRGDTLVYTAIPSRQRETDFPSTHASRDSLVFENLSHDFPQRVIYRRRGADSVVARAEGPGPNGTVRGFSIPMRRVECVAPAP